MKALAHLLKGSIQAKLVRVFVLQIVAISIATVLGVYAAAFVVEKVLIREALNGEAGHFWQRLEADPQASLPDTNNLKAYLEGRSATDLPPEWLRGLATGFYRVSAPDGRHPVVHVSERDRKRLILVFDEMQVSNLAFYFGVAPLSAVLLLLYLLSWFGFIMSRRAVSTLSGLAAKVRRIDFEQGSLEGLNFNEFADCNDPDVLALVNALERFGQRLQRFVARERMFTRNASHELRTPLAVLKGNLELLQKFPDLSSRDEVLARLRRTVRDMESLVETLLILARESESQLAWSPVVLNELLADQLDQVARAVPRSEVRVRLEARCVLEVDAPERVLAIVFQNLLRNAFTYTERGEVAVIIEQHSVTVRDTGCGMSEVDMEHIFDPFYRGHDRSNEGYGLGLSIVSRLCRRFGWPLEVDSEPGVGTVFRVRFPNAVLREML